MGEDLIGIINEQFGEGKWKAKSQSALSLAFMGDCVFDLVVRTVIINHEGGSNKNLHKKCTAIVKAGSQANIIDAIEADLTEEELAIYHHGRNAKSSSQAKNASIVEYRKATGLEALIGFLYLDGQYERLVTLMKMGLERTIWKEDK